MIHLVQLCCVYGAKLVNLMGVKCAKFGNRSKMMGGWILLKCDKMEKSVKPKMKEKPKAKNEKGNEKHKKLMDKDKPESENSTEKRKAKNEKRVLCSTVISRCRSLRNS